MLMLFSTFAIVLFPFHCQGFPHTLPTTDFAQSGRF